MADKKITPDGAPPSPPYSNGYIVHKDGEVVTLLFMRLPPAYTDAMLTHYQGQAEIHAPVVSSVTVTIEGAKTVIQLLTDLLKEKTE